MTIEKLGKLYLANLKAEGKSERTIYTYGKDQKVVEAFFGKGKELRKILPDICVHNFNKS